MKANFYLKEPNSEEETLIYLFFSFDNKRLKYSTGELVHPKFWNSEDQRVRATKKFSDHKTINDRLDKIQADVKSVYRTLLTDEIPITVNLLRKELNKVVKNIAEEKTSFFGFVNKYIQESKGVKAGSTIKTYDSFNNLLNDYCKDKHRKLDFEDIDLEFYNSFIGYLTNDKKLAQNTIGTKIKILKLFMNEATERGLNNNLEFKKKKFKRVSEETDKIYLKKDELDKIYSYDYSNKKHLERVRDLFIIGCFTGLRFSDFAQLKKENFIDGNVIRIRTQKTNETVVIPLHKFVKEIIEKYEGNIPEPLTNQKMNEYLKIIGDNAGINELVETSITKAGKLEKETTEKFNLITTHTARRSFASNLYLADVPAITIMKITGHKTERSFMRYIRITQEENANKLLNHDFFK